MSPAVALITGASSGIGAACAELLAARGFRVFGSSRNPDFRPQAFQPVEMDVTDEQSVLRAVSRVLQEAGAVDVLINNAGFGLAGATEDTSSQEAQRQMDVNFMGTVRVTRAVLPAMRQRRSGLIVNVSSLDGLFGLPFQGFYSASKFALEGWTESLHHECRPFGIRIVLVEPGDVRTGFTANRVRVAAETSSAYAGAFSACMGIIEREEAAGVPPERVARLICGIAETRSSRLRYTSGHATQRLSAVLKRILPASLFQRIIAGFYAVHSGEAPRGNR